ncbi:hypothetical protein DERF_004712 [Dermatophagoides farinae]|uniref:Uncharacterized protein n=1 Tax=Dermatophagoides farinae TaxID=6954 RepID=A0A922L6G6_DERFA|nr:hypothetical protein DERF_004712 [Dermatophagoides farinae]
MHLDDEVAKFFISTKIISTFTNLCCNLKMMMMSMNLVNHTVILLSVIIPIVYGYFSLFLLVSSNSLSADFTWYLVDCDQDTCDTLYILAMTFLSRWFYRNLA